MGGMIYRTGIDVGSTTIKLAVYDDTGALVHGAYRRHYALTGETLTAMLAEVRSLLGAVKMDIAFTGSAGMGMAEQLGFPFLQEVIVSADYLQKILPEVCTFIEIGGEDAKIIFFDDQLLPQIRMNGSCAGGTGAFIDQMALLTNVSLDDFGKLAQQGQPVYTMASRCGVFAKTDVQSLLSNCAAKEDIAASIFHALALQVIASLGRGSVIRSKVLFGGGPLTFFPALVDAFIRILHLDKTRDIVFCPRPELIAAAGVALCRGDRKRVLDLEDLMVAMGKVNVPSLEHQEHHLPSLFQSAEEKEDWEARHRRHALPRRDLADIGAEPCFLGIDSGSTTTKMVLIDSDQRVFLDFYTSNDGDPLAAVGKGIASFRERSRLNGKMPHIARAAVTGYGEDLVKAAFGIDDGIVETAAHFRAAKSFEPEVSFILDIGGQDMKALYIRNGAIADVQINEACSSGCGSFLETFAQTLNYDVETFAQLACGQTKPFDLGTRCTVFMNSRVRQALREGATVEDISAGLAYAIVRNSLHKVLKLRDLSTLGEHIVVQGGTFCNPAVLRAFELLLGREVVRPELAGSMGAYGAALTARQNYRPEQGASKFRGCESPAGQIIMKRHSSFCPGCDNRCRLSKATFLTGESWVFGNRCDRQLTSDRRLKPGENLIARKMELLFDRPTCPEGKPLLTYGIPRVLNIYENFPFWCTFLVDCGFKVVLSAGSDMKLFEQGVGTVMSDNICFPAKLAHGHIIDLLSRGVDRIFYPQVVLERQEYPAALDSYNCPIVTGYPDVIRSSINPAGEYGVPMDSPVVSFQDLRLLEKQLSVFVNPFGVGKKRFRRALDHAVEAQDSYKRQVRGAAAAVMQQAGNDPVILLAGRPYHADPLVNHGIPELISRQGVHIIPEDGIADEKEENLAGSRILTQWAYTNRIIAAARQVAAGKFSGMIQLTSFGCGLDALAVDEAKEILSRAGKFYSLIKIDEIANPGAAKLRVRALVEAIKEKKPHSERSPASLKASSSVCGRERTILVPWFSPHYSPLIPKVFQDFGYKLKLLPPQDKTSVETGLRYVNNDMCYPAVIIIGDVIKALQTGNYPLEETAVMLTQTFGQCRASNYVPLMRKSLQAAGLGEVPVFSIAAGETNLDLALDIDTRELIRRLSLGLIFTDALATMTIATMSHEIKRGAAAALHDQVMQEMAGQLNKGKFAPLLGVLKEAVPLFNGVAANLEPKPVIGVLGEIFVKYNAFSNQHLLEWLIDQGFEVVLPSLVGFFTQRFVNEEFNQCAYLKRALKDRVLSRILDLYTYRYLRQVDGILQNFRYYRPNHRPRDLAKETSLVTSMANQAGEGWLLTAEMIAMVRNGIENIICLQPLGCLANHITGKGVEKRMKFLYPGLNLHFLDMDAGASEVNVLNRLHFILATARKKGGLKEPSPAASAVYEGLR